MYPIVIPVTLETIYAGHRVAQYLGLQDPPRILAFIDNHQNENEGVRCSESPGISTLENCYFGLGL